MKDLKLQVDFLIIGTSKSGTSTLLHYIREHPQVIMPPFEVHFFDRETNLYKGNHWYHRVLLSHRHLHDGLLWRISDFIEKMIIKRGNSQSIIKTEKPEIPSTYLIGEKTPDYYKYPKRLYRYNPSLKLIWIIRNPIDRSYSQYLHAVKKGKEKRTFSQILKDIKANRIQISTFSYISPGQYNIYFKELMRYFKRNQLKIIFLSDLIKQPLKQISDIYQFLGVDDNFRPKLNLHKNKTRLPKNYHILWVFRKIEASIRKIISNRILQEKYISPIFSLIFKIIKKYNVADSDYSRLTQNQRNILKSYYSKNIHEFFELADLDKSKNWL